MSSCLNSDQKFVPHEDYTAKPPTKKLCYGKTDWISSSVAIDIVVAHYKLRAAVQRAEYLERKMHLILGPVS
ncbi:hypothetical protein N7494_002185 [Penicillium frequentans]|uniref:Uncharacterized protein n=1 Tax=Penicillium frequentans TaxID=3151616 RepID=A0AAD6GHS5_9EURO|nr:hypothetical protein N7494_002185 [Penicillium glabrum]